MSYGADWICEYCWENLDGRKRCRRCGKDRPGAEESTEPERRVGQMTEIQFAQRCTRLATLASRWAADALDTRHDELLHPVDREPVERFIREVRERLAYMEENLNG